MSERPDKTRAIVLTSTPINDRMQFIHLYSEILGRVTCRIPLATRSKKSQLLRRQMTPMTVIEIVLKGNPNEEIRQIEDLCVLQSPYSMTAIHPEKSSLCFYMAELIAHTVKETMADKRLWDFITQSLEILEQCETEWSNFHLIFTSGLTNLLGFCIDAREYQPGCRFDLIEGVFTMQTIYHPYYLNELTSEWFCKLIGTTYSTMGQLVLNRQERAALLDIQLAFLSQQIPEMGQLKSVEVLKALFD